MEFFLEMDEDRRAILGSGNTCILSIAGPQPGGKNGKYFRALENKARPSAVPAS